MKLIVLIPAYNEQEHIRSSIESIPSSIDGITEIKVLVVNDGSTDNTIEEVNKTGAHLISYGSNGGVGKAFKTGLDGALELGADILVNIDADGQFDPNDIPKLIKPITDDKADFVPSDRFTDGKGNFTKPENMPSLKYWGNLQMTKLINLLAGQKFNDVSCGFRAYSKKAMLMLNLQGKFTYTQESFLDLAMKDLSIISVPVKVKYGKTIRKSKVYKNVFNYAFRTLYIILRAFRDYSPLKFFGWLGMIFAIISLIVGAFVLFHYITQNAITPYKSVALISLYFFTLAIIIWIVGLIADMFDRIRVNQEKILYYERLRLYEKTK